LSYAPFVTAFLAFNALSLEASPLDFTGAFLTGASFFLAGAVAAALAGAAAAFAGAGAAFFSSFLGAAAEAGLGASFLPPSETNYRI
jgi:hypothetical protein